MFSLINPLGFCRNRRLGTYTKDTAVVTWNDPCLSRGVSHSIHWDHRCGARHTAKCTLCVRNQGWNKATHAAQERTIRINSHLLSLGFERNFGHKPFAVARFFPAPIFSYTPSCEAAARGLRSCPSVECQLCARVVTSLSGSIESAILHIRRELKLPCSFCWIGNAILRLQS